MGTTGQFSFEGSITTDKVNYDGDYTYAGSPKGECRGKTVKVGTLPANSWGLHEVHGNVWEWLEDCWHAYYDGAPQDGGAWTTGGDCGRRVLRGGSWSDGPGLVRSAFRFRLNPGYRLNFRGFRLARVIRE
ncbi:MAG: formylglycine-generating enzyme family protein [Gammaproteobacteria bacterium]|nr:formylglycine-generating enzyme family protein [Gammaproteobacteria bacterium]